MRPFLLAGCVLAAACVHETVVQQQPPVCGIPTFGNSTANYPLVHLFPNASTSLPGGDIGYLITTDGQGQYRLAWTDTLNSPACFNGIVTTNGTIDQGSATRLTGAETVSFSNPGQFKFASIPGSAVHGVDFFASADPVYFDLYLDGSLSVNIYFTDSTSGQLSTTGADPVAATSP